MTLVNKVHKKHGKHVKRKRETKETKSGDVTMANSDEETEAHKLISPVKYPDDIQKRRMLSKTVEIMIIVGMENHVYIFGNDLKK